MIDHSMLRERINGFISLIDLINKYKFIVSTAEVKQSFFRIALIICSIDSDIDEREVDLLNSVFGENEDKTFYEKNMPTPQEIKEFWELMPSMMIRLSTDFDEVVRALTKSNASIGLMYHEIAVDVLKTCMLVDEKIDAREEEFIELYDLKMREYIQS